MRNINFFEKMLQGTMGPLSKCGTQALSLFMGHFGRCGKISSLRVSTLQK